MNQLMIRGHTPHGRLDDSYSVSDLRKPRPLYDFGLLDKRQRRQQQLSLGNVGICLADPSPPPPHCEELDACAATAGSYNNSAAGAKRLVQRRQRQLQRRAARPPTRRQLMESHMRLAYGDDLFDGQRYIVRGRVGIAGLPLATSAAAAEGASCGFQAMRGRILGPVPSGTFQDDSDSDDPDNDNNCSGSVFEWCDRNNSAEDVAKTCARRAGAKITMRRGLSKWIFLYFRVRRVSWEFMVYEEKMNCSTVDLFSDNVLDRWTVKLRFKMLLDAPMKFPLMAFLSRMGLDTDPDIVFSIDGFFGDMLVGGLRNKNSIPHRQVSFNTTPEAMGLQNGDNIFVVKANTTLRNNVESHMEMAKRRANKTEGEEEDEEEEDVDEEEEEHH